MTAQERVDRLSALADELLTPFGQHRNQATEGLYYEINSLVSVIASSVPWEAVRVAAGERIREMGFSEIDAIRIPLALADDNLDTMTERGTVRECLAEIDHIAATWPRQ